MSDKPKKLIFEENARAYLLKGIQKLTDVVGVTLGPKGRYVGLDGSFGPPKITNDGNNIVNNVEIKDQYENMGASIAKEVASKMKETCGDGTTTTILLLGSLVEQGVKNISSGTSSILVKRGMDIAANAIISHLEKQAVSVSKSNEIAEIASSSASGDLEIGKMIAEAFEKVGKEGVISIEEAKETESSIELVEGMQFDRGYLSSYFCTNTEKMIVEMTNPRILVTDRKITTIQEILPLLQEAAASTQEVLIIADDLEGDALSTLVVNRLRGTLKVCAVKAPEFGDRRKAMLEDIATLTGAELISEDTGTNLKDVGISCLGRAKKIVINKDTSTIVAGEGNCKAIQNRIQKIQTEVEQSDDTYDKEKLQERKAKLSGGIAVLRVGAATEPALKQRKQLFEDSLNSTRAAVEQGVVVGGCVALLRAAEAVSKKVALTKEESVGSRIVFEACKTPLRRLIENAGFEPSVILEKILLCKEHEGFNVQSEKIENLFHSGIRDPLKVVKNGLKFSVSAAGVILLSECLVGESSEEEVD